MYKCLTPIAPNIFVTSLWLFEADEDLANSWLLAAIFALILGAMDVIQIAQTFSDGMDTALS